MARSDLAARVHDAPRRVHVPVVGAMVLAVFLISWWSIEFRPPNAVIAFWWPAAALGVVTVLMARRRMLATAGVFVAVFAANFVVGRPLTLDLGYALANAATAWTVVRIATNGARYAPIRSVRTTGRFLAAVAIGALPVSVIGGVSAALFADADLVMTALALYPSHASALLVLTPLALVEWRWRAVGRRREAVLQSLLFVVVVAIAYWPEVVLPLGFTTIAVLLWAAFRLPIGQVAIQLAVLGIVATSATGFGAGSYAELVPGEPRLDVVIVQLYLIVHACSALLVAAARADWGAPPPSLPPATPSCAAASSTSTPASSSPRSFAATPSASWRSRRRSSAPSAPWYPRGVSGASCAGPGRCSACRSSTRRFGHPDRTDVIWTSATGGCSRRTSPCTRGRPAPRS